jgi:hypothetical protein
MCNNWHTLLLRSGNSPSDHHRIIARLFSQSAHASGSAESYSVDQLSWLRWRHSHIEPGFIGHEDAHRRERKHAKEENVSTTGQKPGKGVYTCTKCGQQVVLDDESDTLPPCPRCNGTKYTP